MKPKFVEDMTPEELDALIQEINGLIIDGKATPRHLIFRANCYFWRNVLEDQKNRLVNNEEVNPDDNFDEYMRRIMGGE